MSDVMVYSILDVWHASTETQREQGSQWYSEANSIASTLAAQAGVHIDHAAAVIAHLSPRVNWARNVAGATSLLLTGLAPGMMSGPVARATDAMLSEDPLGTLKGPKTRSFALNILGDQEAVTVDVWALRVATGSDDPKVLSRKGGYESVADAYRRAAAVVGVSPTTMQATTWIVARNGRAS